MSLSLSQARRVPLRLDRGNPSQGVKEAGPWQTQADCGDILEISPDGAIHRSAFETDFGNWIPSLYTPPAWRNCAQSNLEQEYRRHLEALAKWYGYDSLRVGDLLDQGFTLDDVAEFLYTGR